MATPVPDALGPRRRVLVIEDQEALALTLSRLLAGRHDVETVPRVATAIARLGAEAFDVVLCDMVLPDGTGVDVYAWAQAHRPALAERFVFMTGGAFTARVAAFLEETRLPQLEKPFAIADLEAILDGVTPAQR